MRMQCNYMSDTSKIGDTWKENGRLFYEDPDEESIRRLRAGIAAKYARSYSDTLQDDSETLEYQSMNSLPEETKKSRMNVVPMGQRKLLMSEIDFLTDYGDDECLVVYAGAAPGTHISALVRLFPSIRFHLYDKEEFSGNLYDKVGHVVRKGVKLYKTYVTPDLLRQRYRGSERKILYISDIRNNSNSVIGERPTDEDVFADNETNRQILLAEHSSY